MIFSVFFVSFVSLWRPISAETTMPNVIRRGVDSVLQFLLRRVAGKLIAIPIRRRLALFEAATHRPREVQDALLRGILARHKDTAFGRDHGFDDDPQYR